MAGSGMSGARVQRQLLRLLRPPVPRLAELVSERVQPALAAVARSHAGQPAAEVLPALAEVVRAAGAEPDLRALAEFADRISAGRNPFKD